MSGCLEVGLAGPRERILDSGIGIPEIGFMGVSNQSRSSSGGSPHRWTFLSNHAHVLICLARDPEILMREVAQEIGITERAVLNIVADLEAEGLLERFREGRRNYYELNLDHPLRHPIEKHRTVADLVGMVLED